MGNPINESQFFPICAQNKLRNPGFRKAESKISPLFIDKAFWPTWFKCIERMGFRTLQSRLRQADPATGSARQWGLLGVTVHAKLRAGGERTCGPSSWSQTDNMDGAGQLLHQVNHSTPGEEGMKAKPGAGSGWSPSSERTGGSSFRSPDHPGIVIAPGQPRSPSGATCEFEVIFVISMETVCSYDTWVVTH